MRIAWFRGEPPLIDPVAGLRSHCGRSLVINSYALVALDAAISLCESRSGVPWAGGDPPLDDAHAARATTAEYRASAERMLRTKGPSGRTVIEEWSIRLAG